MKRGMIGGGISLIVVAIIIFWASSWISGVQTNNVQQCNRLTEQILQLLDQHDTTICTNAQPYVAISETGLMVAIIMGVLGVALIVIGVIQNPTPKTIVK